MGSYCGIKFDDLSICDSKSYVPNDWAVLFQESDRRNEVRLHEDAKPEDEPYSFVWYETDRETFLWRLSLLGATEATVKRAFEEWLLEQQESWARYANEWEGDIGQTAKDLQTALASFDFDSWRAYANQTLHTRYNFKNPYEPIGPIEKQFHDSDDSYLHFAGYGELLTIRALLEACPDKKTIRLDVSEVINSGYYEEEDDICAQARRDFPFISQPLGPTVILGEGSTDLLVLKRGLEKMHPALLDYFSFFNHAEFNVDGGALFLVKFLKAFAAAKVSSRFVAMFDNDAAGIQAFEQAQSLKLPANFLVMRLPDIDLARSYPTIGPSGPADLDVNGAAGGIELYLGKDALSQGKSLRPIRWVGYVQAAKKYQGEVEGKADVLAAFLKNISTAPSAETARASFPELEEVWQAIFHKLEQSATDRYLYSYELLRRDEF